MNLDKAMKTVQSRAKKDPLVKHTASYEECVMMGIHSCRVRKHHQQLLNSLEAYEQIKLSTFLTDVGILHKRIFLGVCYFEMGLHEQGMEKIEDTSDIRVGAEEREELKTLLGEDCLQKMVKTALMHSTREETKLLGWFCERLCL